MDKRRRQKISITIIIILLFIGVLLIALNWKNVQRILGVANWELTLIALIFIVLSYFCLSYGFTIACKIFNIPMKQLELIEIGYVSAALNNLLDFMGMGGHVLRLMLMQRQGVATGQAFAASLFHSHLHNLGMFCLLPTGLFYLLIHSSVQGGSAISIGLTTAVITFFIVLATVVIFKRPLRLSVLRILTRVIRFVIRKDITAFLNSFDETMTAGVAAIKDRPQMLALIVILVVSEWVLMLVAFWFCFDAFGSPVRPGILITGFAVGISVGNLSMLPGGLGIQEASMAGIFALLGESFERAVLASILFRVVYDFIPYLVSLFFYRHILRLRFQRSDLIEPVLPK